MSKQIYNLNQNMKAVLKNMKGSDISGNQFTFYIVANFENILPYSYLHSTQAKYILF